MSKHRSLILADTHGGSIWGLMQPEYSVKRGGITSRFTANELQLYLYKKFTDMKEKLATREINSVILNGDMVDGPGWRSRKGELFSEELNDQIYMMAEILDDFLEAVNPEAVYQLSGSDYHTSKQQDMEKTLSKEIGSEYVGIGPYDFQMGDFKVNISHGTGGVYWYRGTKMDKILFALMLCKGDSEIYDADIVVRSHFHFAGYLEYPPNQFIYISPCWQCQTDYMRQKDPFKLVPTIGSLELTVDGAEHSHRWYLYPHPPRPIVEIAGVHANPSSVKRRRWLQRW